MDCEHDWSGANGWGRATTVVDQLGVSRLPAEPGVLGSNSAAAVDACHVRHHDWVHVGESRVRFDERLDDIQSWNEVARLLGEAEQLTDEILLGSTNVTGHAPQQVDHH